MYYSVACVNHGFCVWKRKITLNFQNTVYGFSHYLSFPLNGTSTQIVFFKDIITHGIANKVAFDFIYGSFYIVDINGYILLIHISTVYFCQPTL